MLKILQTPARFYPHIGGTELFAYQTCLALSRKGHQVRVICADERPPLGNSEYDSLKVERLSYTGKVANSEITPSLPLHLLKESYDILHAHLPHPWSADISALCSIIRQKPLFLTYYNDITGTGINKIIARIYNLIFLNILLKKAIKIFIINPSYLQSSRFLVPWTEKIIVTPPGVDTAQFRPITTGIEKDTVFFLSCLDEYHEYKGLEYLLRAVKLAKERHPFKLNIGGDGKLRSYYEELVSRYGLTEDVTFLGRISDEQVLLQYNKCGIFVLPSISSEQEGFGMVSIEAMACRKPVIVSDIVGCARDIQDHNAGIVVPPKNPEALADAIIALFENESLSTTMATNALIMVKGKYTWDKNADILESTYIDYLNRNPKS
ncbi:MAG: glycosyltransferase [Chitinispirillaceae bacterium]|nr:glycosyltransferase [Chitinispirillaceae bacterium]